MTRRWNAARLDGYIAALVPARGAGPELPPGGSETIDAATGAVESTILALRTDHGVSMAAANRPSFAATFEWAAQNDLVVTTSEDRVVLTTRGRLLSNELFARLV